MKKVEDIVENFRKRKLKNSKLFRNYSSRLARALSTIRAGRARTLEQMLKG